MRVVLVTSLERGGPLEQALVLARGLSGLGVSVAAVCASDGLAERFSGAGAEAAVIPLRSPLDPARAARIRRLAEGADVIHAQDRRSGLWIRLGRRPRGRPVRFYTVHGVPDEFLPPPAGRRRPGLRAWVAYRGLDAALCRRCEAVIVASEALRELLVGLLGFPRVLIHVIPNGVEPGALAGAAGRRVGSISVLEPVKGLDVFLRAAARLLADRPDLRFSVFGTGTEQPALRRLAAQLGIGDRVELPGHVPRERALAELAVAVSSSYMENCPMSMLEAMAAGVPVVATRVGGVPEIAVPGSAELVEPGDPAALAEGIARLLDDPPRAASQARAARAQVLERFTAKANAEATLTLYARAREAGA